MMIVVYMTAARVTSRRGEKVVYSEGQPENFLTDLRLSRLILVLLITSEKLFSSF
jgi:hypothetical protein